MRSRYATLSAARTKQDVCAPSGQGRFKRARSVGWRWELVADLTCVTALELGKPEHHR